MAIGAVVWGAFVGVYLKGYEFPFMQGALRMFPYFWMGALYGMSDGVKRLVSESRWAYGVAFVVYAVLMLAGISWNKLNIHGFFAIVILMQLFRRYDERIPALLSKVGGYSLEIYVFHYFLIPSFPWANQWLTQPSANPILFNVNFVPVMLLTLIFALAIVALCIALATAVRQNDTICCLLFGGTFNKKKTPAIPKKS